MSVRKMLLVCVLAMAATLPLMGCQGKADKPVKSGGGAAPAPSSNTTNAK
ncbi:MAG: hypothetical protein ACYC3X_21095 [Pirellulaceae bacterium]